MLRPVMLHETIAQRRFLAQQSVAILLRHCFEWLQHCSNIAALYCAENRRFELSSVISPLRVFKLADRQTKPRDSTDKEVSSGDFVHRITY